MDMSYETIPLFGKHRRLYREKSLAYVVSSQEKPDNHPIYVVDTDLGSSIFYNDFHYEENFHTKEYLPIVTEPTEDKEFAKIQEALEQKHGDEWVWSMYFNG